MPRGNGSPPSSAGVRPKISWSASGVGRGAVSRSTKTRTVWGPAESDSSIGTACKTRCRRCLSDRGITIQASSFMVKRVLFSDRINAFSESRLITRSSVPGGAGVPFVSICTAHLSTPSTCPAVPKRRPPNPMRSSASSRGFPSGTRRPFNG
jgi:hypothetical protein